MSRGLLAATFLLQCWAPVSAEETSDASFLWEEPPAAPASGDSGAAPQSPAQNPEPSPEPYPNTLAVGEPKPEDAPTQAPVAAPKRAARNRLIEEIVVTAQKREENLQDVPISVQAFSGDTLDLRGVTNPQDLERVTPGLTYSTNAGNTIIYLRGIGTDIFIPSADPSVATYIDGVYLPFAQGLAQSFFKIDRIEVLKGPQGTLFGRNTTGGAINILTRKPSQEFEADIQTEAASFGARNTKVYASGPLFSDSLSGNLGAFHNYTDTYLKLLDDSPVRQLDKDVSKGLSLRLRWQPSDQISAMLGGFLTKTSGAGGAAATPEKVRPSGTALGVQPLGPYEISVNVDPWVVTANQVASAELAWQPSWLDVKLSGSYQKIESETNFDFEQSPQDFVAINTVPFARIVTSELQFLSKPDGLLPEWLTWTSGLYYFRSIAGYHHTNISGPAPTQTSTLPGPLPPGTLSSTQALAELLATAGVPAGAAFVIDAPARVPTKAYAAYVQTTITPWEWFDITLGGRFQSETRGVEAVTNHVTTDAGTFPLNSFEAQSAKSQNFSPKVALDFKPAEDQLIYLSWQKGFKSGTYNIPPIGSDSAYVYPEIANAYELGNKGTLLDGALRYSVAAFYSENENVQTLVNSLITGGGSNFVNAALAQVYGADFDLTWQLFPSRLPGLVITTSGAYLHGRYKSFPHGPGYDETNGTYFGPGSVSEPGGRDFSGHKTVRTPEYTFVLGPSYAFDAPGGGIEVGGDVYYNSGFFYDTQNVMTQPEYCTLGARASYEYERWHLKLMVYGKNLGNTAYFVDKFALDIDEQSSYAPPRQFGIRASWAFK